MLTLYQGVNVNCFIVLELLLDRCHHYHSKVESRSRERLNNFPKVMQ